MILWLNYIITLIRNRSSCACHHPASARGASPSTTRASDRNLGCSPRWCTEDSTEASCAKSEEFSALASRLACWPETRRPCSAMPNNLMSTASLSPETRPQNSGRHKQPMPMASLRTRTRTQNSARHKQLMLIASLAPETRRDGSGRHHHRLTMASPSWALSLPWLEPCLSLSLSI